MSKSGGFNLKRAVCAAATATLAASGLFVGAAQAADSPISYGDIDKGQTGTVRIHKFESGSLQGNPNERSDAGQGDFINGVPFKLTPINVDLATPEGWVTISKITSVPLDACSATGEANWAAFKAPNTLEAKGGAQPTTVTTSGNGVASANTLPLGAYLVCEQPAPDATNKDGHAVSVVKKSIPFIVTVPRPQADGNGNHTGWIYEVNAYPKNTVLESPKKAVSILKKGGMTDAGVQYTITGKVPNLLGTQNFKHFSVIDQMPSQITDATVTSVAIEGEGAVPQQYWETDYQSAQHFLAVNFTSQGLTYLKGKANKNLVVTITAKLSQISNDKIENVGYLVVDTVDGDVPGDNPPTPVNPGGPGNPPTYPNVVPGQPDIKGSNKSATTWGDIKIRKHDAASTGSGLEGAEFQVFEPADEQACASAAVHPTNKYAAPQGAAITVGATDTFRTVKGGEIVIPGLFIDKADATSPEATASPKTSRCYVVKESKAPAGYVLPEENARTFAIMVKAGTSTDADLDMPNTKVSVPALPLTGASGRVLLMIGGLTMVLGSMGVVMLLRKRNAEA